MQLLHITFNYTMFVKTDFSKYKYFPVRCLICMIWWWQLKTNPRRFLPLLIGYFNWIERNSLSSPSLIYVHACLFIRNKELENVKSIKNCNLNLLKMCKMQNASLTTHWKWPLLQMLLLAFSRCYFIFALLFSGLLIWELYSLLDQEKISKMF